MVATGSRFRARRRRFRTGGEDPRRRRFRTFRRAIACELTTQPPRRPKTWPLSHHHKARRRRSAPRRGFELLGGQVRGSFSRTVVDRARWRRPFALRDVIRSGVSPFAVAVRRSWSCFQAAARGFAAWRAKAVVPRTKNVRHAGRRTIRSYRRRWRDEGWKPAGGCVSGLEPVRDVGGFGRGPFRKLAMHRRGRG